MTDIIEPKEEFKTITEAEVMEALHDPDPYNSVAIELARLIAAYTANFNAHVEKLGYMPPHILHTKARWPIEAIAMRLTTDTIRETLASTKSS